MSLCKALEDASYIKLSILKIVCERSDAFALGMAVPRAFPLYNRKTSVKKNSNKKIRIEFLFVGENTTALDEDEVKCLNTAADSVRLAAKIVDAPCSEMNTNHFLEVLLASYSCVHLTYWYRHCPLILADHTQD